MEDADSEFNPLVSVILPTYNGEEFVEEAIKSVLVQRDIDAELIIIDDGSNDATTDILKRYSSRKGVQILWNNKNRGLASSTNKGVNHASGEILAFIDQDDIWEKSKVKRHIECHHSTEAEVVYSAYTTIDSSGKYLRDQDVPIAKQGRELLRQFCRDGNLIKGGMSTVTVKAEAWRELGGFDVDMKRLADLDLWMQMAPSYQFLMLPQRLVYKRVHSQNFSDDYRITHRDYTLIYEKIRSQFDWIDDQTLAEMSGRIDYIRAVNAFLAGNLHESLEYNGKSFKQNPRVKPIFLTFLAVLDLCTGSINVGSLVYSKRQFSTGIYT